MTDYEKLKEIYDEIDELIAQNTTSESESFKIWYAKANRFLINYYGEDKIEYKAFKKLMFDTLLRYYNASEYECIAKYQKDLIITKGIFKDYLEEMRDDNEIKSENEATKNTSVNNFKSVFIIHGHDGELKEAVARVIEGQGIKAIILHEQANQGATIIEKIEKHSDVGAAIALFTTDDIGCTKKSKESKPRARQNVVFETGFFMGKHGRKKIILIAEKDVELPSDLQGVVYTNQNNWKLDVLKELGAMGFSIDYNKFMTGTT